MTPAPSLTANEITPYIEAAGETDNVDAKGPVAWDGGESSARLTKDILAFANSRDGGVIVIGRPEVDGKFEFSGVTSEQAASFETTKVATWVNNHCAPPVNVVCYRQEYQGREYVLITVAEFADVPVICIKQYELPGKPAAVLLRKGTVYVRTANATSEPLTSVEDVRALIGLATTKRADQMLSMFQAMLKGHSLLPTPPTEYPFLPERAKLEKALNIDLGLGDDPSWLFVCHPVKHREDRWSDMAALRGLLDRSAVRVRDEFPPLRYKLHVRDWGLSNNTGRTAFGLTRSGLFVCRQRIDELRPLAGHKYIDYKPSLLKVIEFFMFLSRFAEALEIGEELIYEVGVGTLTGIIMFKSDPRIKLFPSEPCLSTYFRRSKTLTVETLRASWEDECAKTLQGFVELFYADHFGVGLFQHWIEDFKQRKIDTWT